MASKAAGTANGDCGRMSSYLDTLPLVAIMKRVTGRKGRRISDESPPGPAADASLPPQEQTPPVDRSTPTPVVETAPHGAAASWTPGDSGPSLCAEDFHPDLVESYPDPSESSPEIYPDLPAAEPPTQQEALSAAPAPTPSLSEQAISAEREPIATPAGVLGDPAQNWPWQPPQWQYSTKRARLNQCQQAKLP